MCFYLVSLLTDISAVASTAQSAVLLAASSATSLVVDVTSSQTKHTSYQSLLGCLGK